MHKALNLRDDIDRLYVQRKVQRTKNLWEMRVMVILIVIGGLGTVLEGLKKDSRN